MTADELKAIVSACRVTFDDTMERYSFYCDLIPIAGLELSESASCIDDEFDDALGDAVDDAEPS